MTGWIIGIVTLILLLFICWRKASKAFRERTEEPKFLFLESLGIAAPRNLPPAPTHSLEEDQR
jgi:hypothetical protein